MGADLGLALLAFGIGVLLVRASLCSVACLRELVVDRRPDGIARLATAASAAGVVLLSLAAWAPNSVRLPVDPPLMRTAIIGGLLLGVGAVINGACYIGTVVYLARGQIGFLLTLAGLLFVLRVSPEPMHVDAVDATRRAMSDEARYGIALFASVLAAATALIWRRTAIDPEGRRARLLSIAAAAGVGLLAAVLYSGHPNWNYTSVLAALARIDRGPIMWPAYLGAMVLLAGATTSAVLAHRFEFRGPDFARVYRSLIGGAVMGLGAMQAAGGHDLLLLWSIPGLARGAVVAFATMAVTVAGLLAVGERLRGG